MSLYARLVAVFIVCSLFGIGGKIAPKQKEVDVKARYLITTTDDFIVDIYQNGKHVSDKRRELLNEIFGATVEKINIEVHKGDWLVFHVVSNKMRWGGAAYFGVAGCFARDEFGFVSRTDDGNWSACDTTTDVDDFISHREYFAHHEVRKPTSPWGEGDLHEKESAGDKWNGEAVWGGKSSTWIKVLVD